MHDSEAILNALVPAPEAVRRELAGLLLPEEPAQQSFTEETIRRAALAFAIADGCGMSFNGESVLCCDPRTEQPNAPDRCSCLVGTRAALETTRKKDVKS